MLTEETADMTLICDYCGGRIEIGEGYSLEYDPYTEDEWHYCYRIDCAEFAEGVI